MSRDARLALVFLAASVVGWGAYVAAHHDGWAWAMIASLAACSFFAARASRAPQPATPPPVERRRAGRPPVVAEEMRVAGDPRVAEVERRLAIFGVTLDEREDPDGAFRRGLARAAIDAGAAQLEDGHTDEALSAFESVLQDLGADPAYARTRATAHALRAMAYERRSDPAQARVEYLRALELDPEQRTAQEALARLG